MKPLLTDHIAWPSTSVILAAFKGIAQTFTTEDGRKAAGLPSSVPWIFWIPQGAVCERCKTVSPTPPPPPKDASPGEPYQPLFTYDTHAYANYLLTTLLHPFAKEHLYCTYPEIVALEDVG